MFNSKHYLLCVAQHNINFNKYDFVLYVENDIEKNFINFL